MTIVAQDNNLQIEKMSLGPFGTNTYILSCLTTHKSVVVDAPGEVNKVLEKLTGFQPEYILMTHFHMDHTMGLEELKNKLNVPLAAHEADAGALPIAPEILLKDGDKVTFGDITLDVLHTPGHTPGGICFLTGKYLISGDTIFGGGPGKTLSSNEFKQIVGSLKEKIFTLPEDTQIFPGHGESTVLYKEKEQFAVFSSNPHDPDLHGDIVWLKS